MTITSRLSMSATGANQFGRRDVDIGESQNGQTQILKGHFRWREGCRRRQLVSSVCQFAATLRRQVSNDSSHRSVRSAATMFDPAAGGLYRVGGVISFIHMPVDAYPDLSPPMVEIITQWPGHAAEEIERLVTVPTEVEMNGVPEMSVMRSISLYGLSDVILTFDEGTDDYFARQVVFQRLERGHLSHGRNAHPRAARKPIGTRVSICS